MKGDERVGLWNGCGRKNLQRMLITMALWLTGTVSSVAETPQLQVEVNNTSTPDDDYFCWTPVPARVRMTGGTEPISVVVSGRNHKNGGEVVFQAHKGARPTWSDFASEDNITLTLTENQKWVPFWVAGRKASIEGKDTEIVVTGSENGTELASVPVMVRVRKNASVLTPPEISRFLHALRSHHDVDDRGVNSKYRKYVEAHRTGSGFELGIHGSDVGPYPPLFLVWHRALLLSLERELQAIDPRVTIPYWRFDKHDSVIEDDHIGQAVFSGGFMGTVSGGDSVFGGARVEFAAQSPLEGWVVAGRPLLVRGNDGTQAVIPSDRLQELLETHTSYRAISKELEDGYHDYVHVYIGGGGSLANGSSPADPLFFLLHANVDRAWALWQHSAPAVRFDPTHVDAYPAQGTYPGKTADGPDPFRMGSYAKDPMWPWGGYSGNQNNEDSHDDWPDMRFDLLPGSGLGGSSARPTPAAMVDYLDVRGTGTGTGVCYDHLSFGGHKARGEEVSGN